jgi:transketolase
MFETVSDIVSKDSSTVLMLADIGAFGFKNLIDNFPERAMNIGVFEDGMVSVAAGMSLRGLKPIIYGISPYIAVRALEQIKLNFAYQCTGGVFLTTGAAYDFSTLGYSHYCPEDLGVIKMIPGVKFIAPGTSSQFDSLFRERYMQPEPTYFRLSDWANETQCEVIYGKANVIKKGKKATVVAVSTMLDKVIEACKNEDVTILYYTTLEPFDKKTLVNNCPSRKVLLCEPHYEGTLSWDVLTAFTSSVKINCVGLPRKIMREYGTKIEKDNYYGLTVKNVKYALHNLIKGCA